MSAPNIKSIQEQFENLKELLISKFAGELDSDGELELKKDFSLFVAHLEEAHVNVFDDPSLENKLLEAVPGVKPYWRLIKDMQRHDGLMFQTLSADKDKTRKAVSKMASNAQTLAFVRKNKNVWDSLLVGSDEVFHKNSANVKMLRVAQFIAYAWSGEGSKHVEALQNKLQTFTDNEKHRKIYEHFKKNVHYMSLGTDYARWYDIRNSKHGQPPGRITDGIVFGSDGSSDGLHAYIVVATSNNDTRTQHRQMFDYPTWFMENKGTLFGKTPVDLSKVTAVTPIFACPPLVGLPGTSIETGVNRLFSANPFTIEEAKKINIIPFLSQLNNIDNSDSAGALDCLMDTVYFTIGGGDTLVVNDEFSTLREYPPPDRHKMFLEACAKKLATVSNILSKKTMACSSGQPLHQSNLGTDPVALINGISGFASGLIKHAASFNSDHEFIESLSKRIGNVHSSLSTFRDGIDPSKVTDTACYDSFEQALDNLEVDTFKKRVQSKRVAVVAPKTTSTNAAALLAIVQEYYDKVTKQHQVPGQKPVDFLTHFSLFMSHKIRHGDGATYTMSKGDIPQANYKAMKRHFIHDDGIQSVSFKYDTPELNRAVTDFVNILTKYNTSDDILVELQKKIDKVAVYTNSASISF